MSWKVSYIFDWYSLFIISGSTSGEKGEIISNAVFLFVVKLMLIVGDVSNQLKPHCHILR